MTRGATLAAFLFALGLAAAAGAEGGPPPPVVTTGTTAEDRPLFIASFPVESALHGSLFAGDARVTLRFDAKQARKGKNELVRRLGRAIGPDGHLVVSKLAYPLARERPGKAHLASSFVLDFDEPPFGPLLTDARARFGPKPTVDDLVKVVDQYITKKDSVRAFDIASVVARRHEGDCTEHAVLLAATARAFGIPARVVEGLVLVENGKKVFAFGHAWVEVYRDAAWGPADAALLGAGPRVYLPLELMVDESPSYSMSIAKTSAGTLAVRGVLLSD